VAVKDIALDTNAYTAFKLNQPEAVKIIQHAQIIGVSSIVLGELFGGFAAGSRQAVNRRELTQFLASPRIKILVVDEDTAEQYAIVYSDLRKIGKPILTNDMWIAAHALQHNLSLFSFDNHFQNVKSLHVGTQLSDFI
jgi:predicted nucleic acid-binding protein